MDDRRFKAFLPAGYHAWCLYCGERAQHRDHFNPWATCRVSWWVPACASCNLTLGGLRHKTWGERIDCLIAKLQDRNKTLLETDIERSLQGTGGALRGALLKELAKQGSIEVRLLWADAMSEMLGDLPLDCFEQEARDAVSAAIHALTRREMGSRA